jgi:hypothetical protein
MEYLTIMKLHKILIVKEYIYEAFLFLNFFIFNLEFIVKIIKLIHYQVIPPFIILHSCNNPPPN